MKPGRACDLRHGRTSSRDLTDRMLREFQVNARVSKLQVAYRETINQIAEAQGKYIHKIDDEGIYEMSYSD